MIFTNPARSCSETKIIELFQDWHPRHPNAHHEWSQDLKEWQEPPNHQLTPPPPGRHSVPYRHIGQAQWCLHFTLCWMSVWGLQKFCQLRKRVVRAETPNVEKSKSQITSGGSKLTCMKNWNQCSTRWTSDGFKSASLPFAKVVASCAIERSFKHLR